jgi:uncharacterized protein DUF4383
VRRVSAQPFAAVVGAAFLLLGLLGFVPGITAHHGELRFAGQSSGAMLLGLFRVSILQNLGHLALGAAGLACSSADAAARRFLAGAGVASLALWTLGVSGGADWLPVNADDNWLHLGLAVTALALGYVAAADARVAGATPSRL